MNPPLPDPAPPDLAADMAAILAHALADRAAGQGALPDLLGLEGADLARLAARFWRGPPLPDLDRPLAPPPPDQAAIALMIQWRGGSVSTESGWLAQILARRAMEGGHLWEDLGLPDRARLSGLIAREFPRLFAANRHNLRWKRFFYRQICAGGSGLCPAPNCDDCPERSACLAPVAD